MLINEVHDLINNLDVNKSSTGIPIRCIKIVSDKIVEPLTVIFNHSLIQGVMPDSKSKGLGQSIKVVTRQFQAITDQYQLFHHSHRYLRN